MPNVVRRDPAQLGFLKYLLKDAPSPIVLVEWLSLFIDINPAKLIVLWRLYTSANPIPLNLNEAAIEVEIRPLRSKQLTQAHAGSNGTQEQRVGVVPKLAGRIQGTSVPAGAL